MKPAVQSVQLLLLLFFSFIMSHTKYETLQAKGGCSLYDSASLCCHPVATFD